MRSSYKWIVPLSLLFFSCSKTKPDDTPDRPFSQNIKSSTARLVLMKGFDLMVNGKKITNGLAGSGIGGEPEEPPNPTPYFPQTGKPGNTYFIPQEFINEKGKATVGTFSPGTSVPLTVFEVEDNYAQPLDYYWNLAGNPAIFTIPRPVIKPSRPQNILVRLVNLASSTVAGSGVDEKLSLAYADGDPVSPITSAVGKGQWSNYAELPYGTYQFRIMVDGSTRQYPALPPQQITIPSRTDFTILGTKQYYTQRRVFQPGGVYTIVVHYSDSRFEVDQAALKVPVNVFSFITDLSPAANLSYARVQVVNAFAGQEMKVSVGQQGSETISYGHSSNYTILTTGSHKVRIETAPGQPPVEQQITVKGGDNFTLWAYPGNKDSLKLLTVQNNMSGIVNLAAHEDGSDGATSVNDPLSIVGLPVQTRFLNLCPEIPQASFTTTNGAPLYGSQGYPAATVNLPFGAIPDPVRLQYPYIGLEKTRIEAYQSNALSVPGSRLFEVAPLSASDFIRMPAAFYPNGWPTGEAGVYTVALIGRQRPGRNPQLIVIKHNK